MDRCGPDNGRETEEVSGKEGEGMNPDQKYLEQGIDSLQGAIDELFSAKRQRPGIHGQTIGAEGWRVDFTGFQLGAIQDAISELRDRVIYINQTKT